MNEQPAKAFAERLAAVYAFYGTAFIGRIGRAKARRFSKLKHRRLIAAKLRGERFKAWMTLQLDKPTVQ